MPSDLQLGGSASVRQLIVSASGTVKLGGEAGAISSGYHWPPLQVLPYVASGGLALSGIAGNRRVQFFYTSTGKLRLDGTALVAKGFISAVGGGKISFSGNSVVKKGFYQIQSSGSLIISGAINKPKFIIPVSMTGSINLSLATPTHVILAFSVARSFSWNVDNNLEVSIDASWNILPATTYYYEVQGITNPEQLDSECTNVPAGQQFLQIIMANNVDELCQQFTAANDSKTLQIKSLRKFSRPVYRSQIERDEALGIDHSCPEWVDEDYSTMPSCLMYSLTESALVRMVSQVTVQENFFVPVVSGGLILSGSTLISSKQYVGLGGIKVGGSATNRGSVVHYTPTEVSISLGGQALVKSPVGMYIGSGGLLFGGNTGVISPRGSYVGEGGIRLLSGTDNLVRYFYTPVNGSLFTSGSAGLKRSKYYYHVGDRWRNLGAYNADYNDDYDVHLDAPYEEPDSFITGGLILSSLPYFLKMNYYAFTGSGTLSIGGSGGLRHYGYAGSGTLIASAAALSGMKNSAHAIASGGLIMYGTAIQKFKLPRYGSGGITLSSSVGVSSQAFSYGSSGKITLAGQAHLPLSDLGTFTTRMTSMTSLLLLESIFPEDIISNQLVSDSDNVVTTCGCGPLPVILRFKHNLFAGNSLNNFIVRNGIVVPDDLPLFYHSYDNAWRVNLHWLGVASDGVSKERWNFIAEWACVNEINGLELDVSMWKFSVTVTQMDLISGHNDQTRIVYFFGIDMACLENTLDFTFNVNTQKNGLITASIPIIAESPVFLDEAGLFKSRYWLNNPEAVFSITQNRATKSAVRYDISPIFPKDPLILNTRTV